MEDDFDGPELDRAVWLPHYLPQWSSRAASAATYVLRGSCLVLSIPSEQGLWCADDHQPALRVSAVQSGCYAGPVGSTVGQQPFKEGLVVREEQEPFWGCTPRFGRVAIRARMELSERSMASLWLVGREVDPRECAEICVFEVFGDAATQVGSGLHSFRDPDAREDFATTDLDLDVAAFHTYAVDWTAEAATFSMDGRVTRICPGPPAYPMQLMLGVFDFPEKAPGLHHVPSLVVDLVDVTDG